MVLYDRWEVEGYRRPAARVVDIDVRDAYKRRCASAARCDGWRDGWETDWRMSDGGARPCQWLLLALLVGSPAALAAADAAPQTAAVFDLELIDTSLEGEVRGRNPAEQDRLRLTSDRLRQELARSGAYVLVDPAPAAAAVKAAGHMHGCNGCEADIARTLGAEVAITGTVQKVSNLILNINVYITDAASRRRIRAFSVDIRGNTDESWARGVSYLVRNRLSGN